jgi:hypothetical protein
VNSLKAYWEACATGYLIRTSGMAFDADLLGFLQFSQEKNPVETAELIKTMVNGLNRAKVIKQHLDCLNLKPKEKKFLETWQSEQQSEESVREEVKEADGMQTETKLELCVEER